MLVLRDGKVLLGLRSNDKSASDLHGEGTWTMPGGKVDIGERLVDAATRELAEETGLIPHSIEAVCVQDDITNTAHYTTVGFKVAMAPNAEPKTMEPEEITEWRWFDMNDLPTNLYLPSKKFLGKYKAGVFYG